MTAGHNALRGSGPGQKHAFEDAVAHVGCPDRRIDRRCIGAVCPPNHCVTPDVRRDSLRRERDWFPVALALGLAISRPIVEIDCIACSSESWESQTAPTLWHSR